MAARRVTKNASEIFSEWDALAQVRFDQITSGTDLTFNHVLGPCLINLAAKWHDGIIIDAGCGVGVLCEKLAELDADIIGLDPSPDSITLAKQHFSQSATFLTDTLEAFAGDNPECTSVIVSNMVIMDVADLKSFVRGAATALKPGGHFVFSLGHPCFWHDYAGFSAEPWFAYAEEQMVETPFRISRGEQKNIAYTHVHRPLSLYASTLADAGFVIEQILEPMPAPDIEAQYPKPWGLPRFMVMDCRKDR